MPNPTNEELNVATWKIPNALGIIGSSANNEFNGMTASWITQVSMEPLLIAVGIDNKSITHGLMSASEYFSLNLFSENYTKVFVKFSKPADYKEGFLNEACGTKLCFLLLYIGFIVFRHASGNMELQFTEVTSLHNFQVGIHQ